MNLIYKVRSEKKLNQVIIDLKESLTNHKFGVLWEMNFKDKLNETGLEFNHNYYVFEVCNPQQAKRVLDKNLEVGFFLPCKLVIYEENTDVFIGMIKPTELISNFNDTELTKIGSSIEKELIQAIETAK